MSILICVTFLTILFLLIVILYEAKRFEFMPQKAKFLARTNKCDTQFNFDEQDLRYFLNHIFTDTYKYNNGGMKSPDLFTFHFALKKIQPDVVIESGVFNGLSTKLIRQTLGEHVIIICLDPREIPIHGFKDQNKNTIYFTGNNNFKDFNDLDLRKYKNKKMLAFFDDHQNQAQRLLQSNNKNIKHLFFNDNYPINGGCFFTLEHLLKGDARNFDLRGQPSYSINTLPQIDLTNKYELINLIKTYIIFPNIFSTVILLDEPGKFDSTGYFETFNPEYKIFYEDRKAYSWNTYVSLY